jgi:hypothetical protein
LLVLNTSYRQLARDAFWACEAGLTLLTSWSCLHTAAGLLHRLRSWGMARLLFSPEMVLVCGSRCRAWCCLPLQSAPGFKALQQSPSLSRTLLWAPDRTAPAGLPGRLLRLGLLLLLLLLLLLVLLVVVVVSSLTPGQPLTLVSRK